MDDGRLLISRPIDTTVADAAGVEPGCPTWSDGDATDADLGSCRRKSTVIISSLFEHLVTIFSLLLLRCQSIEQHPSPSPNILQPRWPGRPGPGRLRWFPSRVDLRSLRTFTRYEFFLTMTKPCSRMYRSSCGLEGRGVFVSYVVCGMDEKHAEFDVVFLCKMFHRRNRGDG